MIHPTERKKVLIARKAKFESRIAYCEERIQSLNGIRGYGCEVALSQAEDRLLVLKQALYEVNLELGQ